MFKDKFRLVCDWLLRNKKFIFPVAIVAAVAVTVSVALGASGGRKVEGITPESQSGTEESSEQVEDVPLVDNEDSAISTLIYQFYDAQANGDLEILKSLCDEISELDLLSFEEKAKYIEYYPKLEIFTKEGMNEGETVVYVYYWMTFVNHEEEFPGYTSYYVCTADDGSLYIKRSNFSDELNAYTSELCSQDDVVEFNNRVTAEYDQFKEEHPDLANYPEEVMAEVNTAVGVKWSKMQAEAQENVSDGDAGAQDPGESEEPEQPEEEGPRYATASTTVNVRSSDSEQADRLGKVSGGSRIEVLEQQLNGWSKVVYEGKEGYIKSEFLQMEESVPDGAVIGSVKATTNVNVRASASETGAKLGTLVGGDTAELIAVEGDWCKIRFNGQAAYVKAEFVERQ